MASTSSSGLSKNMFITSRWSSCAQGGSAWIVFGLKTGAFVTGANTQILIAKTTLWRSCMSYRESLGLAVSLDGGDVHVRTPQCDTITAVFSHEESTIQQHRLLIDIQHGHPLWMYESERELMKIIYTVGSVHKALSDQGITHHCGITCNSVQLVRDSKLAPGFLTDFDLDRLLDNTALHKTVDMDEPERDISSTFMTDLERRSEFLNEQGAVLGTGTPLCAPCGNLLLAAKNKVKVPQTNEQDIESLMRVVGFAALRKLLENCQDDTEYKLLYSFLILPISGRNMLDTIILINSRKSNAALRWVDDENIAHIVDRELSPIFAAVLSQFANILQSWYYHAEPSDRNAALKAHIPGWLEEFGRRPFKLTHEHLLEPLLVGISKVEGGAGTDADY